MNYRNLTSNFQNVVKRQWAGKSKIIKIIMKTLFFFLKYLPQQSKQEGDAIEIKNPRCEKILLKFEVRLCYWSFKKW